MLIGNKSDLEHRRQVSKEEEGVRPEEQPHFPGNFCQTAANVNEAFCATAANLQEIENGTYDTTNEAYGIKVGCPTRMYDHQDGKSRAESRVGAVEPNGRGRHAGGTIRLAMPRREGEIVNGGVWSRSGVNRAGTGMCSSRQ